MFINKLGNEMDFKDKKCLLVRCFKMEVYSANSVHHALNFVDSDDHIYGSWRCNMLGGNGNLMSLFASALNFLRCMKTQLSPAGSCSFDHSCFCNKPYSLMLSVNKRKIRYEVKVYVVVLIQSLLFLELETKSRKLFMC